MLTITIQSVVATGGMYKGQGRNQRKLLKNVPHDAPNFTNDDFREMVNLATAIDEEEKSPKNSKLYLLTPASSIDGFQSNVVEGIADL